jgi:protein O-mannosyl-transferase
LNARVLHGLVLFAACALVYANALSGPYIFDDEPAIERNPDIRRLWPPTWARPSVGLHAAVNSRPLTSFSLALNYALGGLAIEGYRLVNIALHALCGLALYGVVRRLLTRIAALAPRAGGLALASALLWLVHPLNSQVVNYIIQRSEALMALCYLGTLYCFLRGVVADGWRWQIGAVVCCALGMAAKEVMVSAPLAVLLCDGLFVSGSYRAALLVRRGLYGGLACSWLVLLRGLWTMPHGATIGFDRGVDVWTYLLNQCQMILTYLRLAVWPHPLVLDYGFPRPLQLVDVWLEAVFALLIVGLSGLALYRHSRWAFIGAWALLVLAPTSSFVPLVNEVGAERRFYLPLAAMMTGLVVVAAMAWRRWGLGQGVIVVGLAVVSLGWMTVERNEDYASKIAIWESSLSAVEDNPRGHYNLANELETVGDLSRARSHYRRALALDPVYGNAHNNFALLLVALGDTAKALVHYRRAIELEPDFAEAHGNLAIALEASGQLAEALVYYRRAVDLGPELPPAYYNLAMALEKAGARAEGLAHYRRGLVLDPGMVAAHYRLGIALAAEGDLSEARLHLRQVVARAPDHAAAHFYLGRLLVKADSLAAGMAHYRRAVALEPELVEGHYNLGSALLRRGAVGEALDHYRRVVALDPGFAEGHNNLGIALQLAGRLAEAAAEFRRALQIRPGYAEARANLAAALAAEAAASANKRPPGE